MKTAVWNVTTRAFLTETLVCRGRWYGPCEMAYNHGSHWSLLSCKGKLSCSCRWWARPSGGASQHSALNQLFLPHSISRALLRTLRYEWAPKGQPAPEDVREPHSVGSGHSVSPTDNRTSPSNSGSTSSGIPEENNTNIPCQAKAALYTLKPDHSPLCPPFPRRCWRIGGPCLKVTHEKQFDCSSLFWGWIWYYGHRPLCTRWMQGQERSCARSNAHTVIHCIHAVTQRIFQFFHMQEKETEYFLF